MGPCQGAYCSFRAAGILHTLKRPQVDDTNVSLRDFLQERWKGNLPILDGQQLRQARFNELIYVDVLNTTSLPGKRVSRLASIKYEKPEEEHSTILKNEAHHTGKPLSALQSHLSDTIVIGAGLAGLITAWRAGIKRRKIDLIAKGWGVTYWNTGCIDIFGYQPPDYLKMVDSPLEFLEKFATSNPGHPYALAGLTALENAVQEFQTLCQEANYPYHGALDTNIQLPTSLGTLRPSCLVPETMIAGNMADRTPMLIVGFNGFLDFFPTLIADNLIAQGILAREIVLDLPILRNRKFLTAMVLARLFDNPEFRQEVIDALKPKLGNVGRIGFPAVLGLMNPMNVMAHLQSSLGLPVFEIPGLPPSIPSIRLHNLLVSAIEQNHGTISNGMSVSQVSSEGKLLQTIWSEAASRLKPHDANTYVLATGGILGGGIIANNNGYAQETIFGLPLYVPEYPSEWMRAEFLSDEGHPLFRIGVRTDSRFQPVDKMNERIYENLYAVGGILGNCDPIRERSLEGIALTTGFTVGEALSESALA
jgi:glycerol-3-phosphate dehydrogenase subunit B